MVLSACQCRMARAATGLTRSALADRANVSAATLSDFELGKREPYERTLRDIREAFEALGVTFLEPDELGEGVRYLHA
jgi:transcriptional regulator with XRE-family HTH domain